MSQCKSKDAQYQTFRSCCLIEYVPNLLRRLPRFECTRLQYYYKYNSDPMYVYIGLTSHPMINEFIGTGGLLPHTHIVPIETTIC